MIRAGLTGGYATGKSFVAGELERLGCHVVYADRLGHKVLEPDGEAYEPTVRTFGADIKNADGTIDRKKLASLVFTSPVLLQTLNSFVHPAVFRLEESMFAGFEAADPNGVAIVEAAILIETGRYRFFDRLILTACSEDLQIARGMARDHLTREQVLARLQQQMPSDEKKRFAHSVIDTGVPKEITRRQINSVYDKLKQLAESRQA